MIGRTLSRWRCCWTSSRAESRSVLKLEPFNLRLAIPEQTIGNEADFPGRYVKSEFVSPGAEGFKQGRLPALELDIRHRGKTRIENSLEVEDLLEVLGFEPGR